MKKVTFKSLLIIALAIIPMTVFGQSKTPTNYWFIGLEGGATTMVSDNQPFKMDQTSWDAGLYGGYMLHNKLAIYGNLGYVNLKGKYDDFFTIDECNLFQANINFGLDVLQFFSFNPDRKISIMPHVGIGGIMHKTKTTFADGSVILNGYNEDGANKGKGFGGRKLVYDNTFGLKFGFNLSEKFDLGLDFVAVKTDTEGLDNYIHGKHSDWYGYANIGIAYKFNRKEVKPWPECPECPTCPECPDLDKAIADAIDDYVKNNPCPEPEVEEEEAFEKVWEEKDIHLTFKVGKAEVENTDANKEEVKKVSDDIDNGREISKIKTIGHASPEGNEEQNQKLSEDRAQATADFIQKQLGDQAEGIEFEASGEGSDWDGFYTALENSEIANKAEIAEQIKNSEDPTATLNQMRVKYPELNEILNGLRVTRIYINK